MNLRSRFFHQEIKEGLAQGRAALAPEQDDREAPFEPDTPDPQGGKPFRSDIVPDRPDRATDELSDPRDPGRRCGNTGRGRGCSALIPAGAR